MLKIRKGFTLVELLVVIAIIGVIAALVIVNLSSARGKGRDARRKQDVETIRTAVEAYIDDNNGTSPGVSGTVYTSDAANWTTLQTSMSSVLSALPKDPKNTAIDSYVYRYTVNASGAYEIDAKFEKDTNSMLNSNDNGNNDNKFETGTLLTLLGV
ncbi:type II secretion system protein [Candidatus Berkelbacteria bacterium]|nr:type II secretion system protein [Candidatus Berkelbacteria bacterium]MBI4029632.1 type II secretion system protein [Candidatus Berkelbacteria bacterium]